MGYKYLENTWVILEYNGIVLHSLTLMMDSTMNLMSESHYKREKREHYSQLRITPGILMKNTSNSAPLFLVAEQEITQLEVLMINVNIEVGSGNFNLAPPPMIAMEDDDEEEEDGVY